MLPVLREALSRVATRVAGSRFSRPVARVVLAAVGLLVLAFVGKNAVAGAMSAPAAAAPMVVAPVASSSAVLVPDPLPPPSPTVGAAPTTSPIPAPVGVGPPATAEDPVILNTATVDDLRRLPGVGEKRANAIVALRGRLGGRFRAVEDLLKVKGIGRATLRRLRPLVRLDPPVASPDGGATTPP